MHSRNPRRFCGRQLTATHESVTGTRHRVVPIKVRGGSSLPPTSRLRGQSVSSSDPGLKQCYLAVPKRSGRWQAAINHGTTNRNPSLPPGQGATKQVSPAARSVVRRSPQMNIQQPMGQLQAAWNLSSPEAT